jgi:prepilin signal peptidase PulO-like enzyme (type II secretory pathway)
MTHLSIISQALANSEFMWAWTITAIAAYIGLCFFCLQVENIYLREFKKERTTLRDAGVAWSIGLVSFLSYIFFSRHTLVPVAALPLSIAAAALVGTWRVDRQLLLIPDRFQLLGLGAGVLFVLIAWLSGEYPSELFKSRLMALFVVGLLWLMSFLYLRLRGNVGFGLGDIKLLGWLGLIVGHRIVDIVFLAIILAITILAYSIIKKSLQIKALALPKASDAMPFGPAIVAAAFFEGLANYGGL